MQPCSVCLKRSARKNCGNIHETEVLRYNHFSSPFNGLKEEGKRAGKSSMPLLSFLGVSLEFLPLLEVSFLERLGHTPMVV